MTDVAQVRTEVMRDQTEHAKLVDRLCELMSPEDVRAAAPVMSIADLRSVIASCEAQERRYTEAGFYTMEDGCHDGGRTP